MAARQGPAQADELDITLRSLAEGLRVVSVLLAPYMPESTESCSPRSARRDLSLERAGYGASPGRSARCPKLAPLFPKPRMIDSHTHLDRGPAPEAELVAAGARSGREADPHDRHGRASRGARRCARPRPTPRSTRRSATTRTRPRATTTRSPTSCASSPQHPRCLAIGETGLDDFRDYAPRADQERAFQAQIELAHEVGKPLVIHTRAAEDDTIDSLARERARASR